MNRSRILQEMPLHTGFPSPADDDLDPPLDLTTYLIANPPATFFLRVARDSLSGSGARPGDLLIVDRSLEPGNHDVVIVCLNGEFQVRRYWRDRRGTRLLSENASCPSIDLRVDGAEIWGVVLHVIHSYRHADHCAG